MLAILGSEIGTLSNARYGLQHEHSNDAISGPDWPMAYLFAVELAP
jgi:hypothetical protein